MTWRSRSPASELPAVLAANARAERATRRAEALEHLVEIGIAVMSEPDLPVLIARLGSDEFAALLVNTPRHGARAYAERIRRAIGASPFPHGPITVRAGTTTLPDDVLGVETISGEALMRAADRAPVSGEARRAEPCQRFRSGCAISREGVGTRRRWCIVVPGGNGRSA